MQWSNNELLIPWPVPTYPDSFGPIVTLSFPPVIRSLSRSLRWNLRQCVLRDWWHGWPGKSQPVCNSSAVGTWSLKFRSAHSVLFRCYSEIMGTEVPLLLLLFTVKQYLGSKELYFSFEWLFFCMLLIPWSFPLGDPDSQVILTTPPPV
jgi:hypothetical protein